MGMGKKADHKGEEVGGKVKEGAGKAVGNESLEAEGRGDQASAGVKQGADKLKDAASDVKDGLTGSDKGGDSTSSDRPS